MPWKSDKQRRWAHATNQPWAKKWDSYAGGGAVMDRKEEDLTITRKLPNGASMTMKSPQGSQMQMNGIFEGMVGGYSPTPVADNVKANLTPGEFVVNQPAAQKYKSWLTDINNEGRQMLAMGGWTNNYAMGGRVGYAPGGEVLTWPELRQEAINALKSGRGLLGRWTNPTEVEILAEMERIAQAKGMPMPQQGATPGEQFVSEETVAGNESALAGATAANEQPAGEMWEGATIDEWIEHLNTSSAAETKYDIISIIQSPTAPQRLKNAAAQASVANGSFDSLDQHTKRIIDGFYKHQAGENTGVEPQTNLVTNRETGMSSTAGQGYTANLGQQLQNEVTVPVGADKYQNDPRYELVRDDGSFRMYRLNPAALEAFNQFNRDTGIDVAGGQERQRAANEAAIAQQESEAARVAGLLENPDFAQAEENQLGRNQAWWDDHVAAMEKVVMDDTRITGTGDPQLDLAADTARRERNVEFKYLAGETYDAPNKETAMAWVRAGIVAKEAIFRLPNGVTGTAK